MLCKSNLRKVIYLLKLYFFIFSVITRQCVRCWRNRRTPSDSAVVPPPRVRPVQPDTNQSCFRKAVNRLLSQRRRTPGPRFETMSEQSSSIDVPVAAEEIPVARSVSNETINFSI